MRKVETGLLAPAAAIIAFMLTLYFMDAFPHSDHIQEPSDPIYCAAYVTRRCERPEILRNEREQCERALDARGCCAYRNERTGEFVKFDICSPLD